jgi:co-chaperonin GroES (HSP10)
MIIPAGHRILVKADEVETVSKGGIVVVASSEEEKLARAAQTNGTVVSVGKFAYEDYDDAWCEVGDRVTYVRHSGRPLIDPESGEEFVILNDLDVLSIIRG